MIDRFHLILSRTIDLLFFKKLKHEKDSISTEIIILLKNISRFSPISVAHYKINFSDFNVHTFKRKLSPNMALGQSLMVMSSAIQFIH